MDKIYEQKEAKPEYGTVHSPSDTFVYMDAAGLLKNRTKIF